jgi:mRNA-degrading endonuclease HigB of HigAB toxin-antitoxin module
MKKIVLLLFIVLGSLFAEFGAGGLKDDPGLAELNALEAQYSKIAKQQKKVMQKYQEAPEKVTEWADSIEQENNDQEDDVGNNFGATDDSDNQDFQTESETGNNENLTGSITKPDIQETKTTLKKLVKHTKNYRKIANSEPFVYMYRWFLLANQVDPNNEKDIPTIFYLVKDSLFENKLADVEEMTYNEDFLPDDDLIDGIYQEYKKWIKYLKPVIDDLDSIQENFYNKVNFFVTPTQGLNIRENPITGIRTSRKTAIPKGKKVSMKYFVKGSGKYFSSGKFNQKWAKIEVKIHGRKVLGWVDMRYLERY